MYAEKYQWIKGDKTGNVEQYLSHDNEWVYFIGGGRIKSEIMPEYMLQVDADTPLDFSVSLKNQSKKSLPANIQVDKPERVTHEEANPVKSLLKRASKQSLNCVYSFDIQIPKQSVYNLIQDSFEAEIDSIVLDLIMSDISKDGLYENVKEQIKKQILKFYNNGNDTNTSTESGELRSKEEPSAVDEQSPAQELS
jgi:hypothetical protein